MKTTAETLAEALEVVKKTLLNDTPETFNTGVHDTVWQSPFCTLYDYADIEISNTASLIPLEKAVLEAAKEYWNAIEDSGNSCQAANRILISVEAYLKALEEVK